MAIHRSFIVCSTARTGSSFFCDSLTQTGLCGAPREYLLQNGERVASRNWPELNLETDYLEFLNRLMETTASSNGVFGVKTMAPDLTSLCQNVAKAQGRDYESDEDLDLLHSVFPDLRFMWVKRQDSVLQAISMWKAKQTGQFHSFREKVSEEEPQYDFQEIRKICNTLAKRDQFWQEFFKRFNLQPCEFVYEDFSVDPGTSVKRALTFLEIDYDAAQEFPSSTFEKLSDAVNEEWKARFLEDEARAE